MIVSQKQNLDIEVHRLTKDALKGNMKALEIVIGFLSSFRITMFKAVAYLVVYQVIMNLDPGVVKECMLCNGLCCKIGSDIPIYSFDLEDLRDVLQLDMGKSVKCSNSQCHIQRPCPFQVEWRCTIHRFKPYACLSYPFASEEIQKPMLINIRELPPKPIIPNICLAAKKIWDKINNGINKFKENYGRMPEPMELIKYLDYRAMCATLE